MDCRVIEDDECTSNPDSDITNVKIPHIILGEALEVNDDT